MNWGHKIALLYLGFVTLILTLVFMANNQKVELVSSDYYDQEIKFQDKINAQNNEAGLNEHINVEVKNKEVVVTYPGEMCRKNSIGEVKFYRPSDASLDFKTSMRMDKSGKQNIVSKEFRRGLYKVQFAWTMDNRSFYLEQPVFIN